MKKTIPIKMTDYKNRFEVCAFFDTPVTLSIWQLLDEFLQL